MTISQEGDGRIRISADPGKAIHRKSYPCGTIISAVIRNDESADDWEDCEITEAKQDHMKYSVVSIIETIRSLGKYEEFRRMLESARLDWDFIGANYLSENHPAFKQMCEEIVRLGILTKDECISMLAHCVWSAD